MLDRDDLKQVGLALLLSAVVLAAFYYGGCALFEHPNNGLHWRAGVIYEAHALDAREMSIKTTCGRFVIADQLVFERLRNLIGKDVLIVWRRDGDDIGLVRVEFEGLVIIVDPI